MNNNCFNLQHNKCKDKIYVVGTPGPRGRDGAGTITIGTTTTGDPGTDASVTNSGTAQNAILNFTIPRGETGPTGAQGPQGETGATGEQGPAGEVATNEYGYKYDTTNDSITLTANTVTTVPLAQTGPLNVITGSTENALTIGSTGTYKIDYFFNGISNIEGNITLSVYNNSNLLTGSTLTLNLETTDERNISGSIIASLSESDVITLGIESTTEIEVTPSSNTNAYLSIVKLA